VTQVDPIFGAVGGGEAITFTGYPFPNGDYTCRFTNGVSIGFGVGVRESDTSVRCVTPPFTAGFANVSLLLNEVPFAVSSPFELLFEFYQCPPTSACDNVCLSNPYCGWCAQAGACTGLTACQASGNYSLWLQQCPVLSSSFPTHVQIATNLTADVYILDCLPCDE